MLSYALAGAPLGPGGVASGAALGLFVWGAGEVVGEAINVAVDMYSGITNNKQE